MVKDVAVLGAHAAFVGSNPTGFNPHKKSKNVYV